MEAGELPDRIQASRAAASADRLEVLKQPSRPSRCRLPPCDLTLVKTPICHHMRAVRQISLVGHEPRVGDDKLEILEINDELEINEKLRIKMNPDFPFYKYRDERVTEVALRGGSFTAGTHHELMLTLADGTLLRISRNNSSDTFQIGAERSGPRGELKVLVSSSPLRDDMTVRDALGAFGDVNRAMPRYDHGDCQEFAAHIYRELTGKSANEATDNSLQGDFM